MNEAPLTMKSYNSSMYRNRFLLNAVYLPNIMKTDFSISPADSHNTGRICLLSVTRSTRMSQHNEGEK